MTRTDSGAEKVKKTLKPMRFRRFAPNSRLSDTAGKPMYLSNHHENSAGKADESGRPPPFSGNEQFKFRSLIL